METCYIEYDVGYDMAIIQPLKRFEAQVVESMPQQATGERNQCESPVTPSASPDSHKEAL